MKVKYSQFLVLSLSLICLASAADDYPRWKFSGSIMLDYDDFDANFLENETEGDSDYEIRRLRLGAESDFDVNWDAKLSVDVGDGIVVKDAYVKYSGWDLADITIGKQKEPFGLERQISSKNLVLIERAMTSGAIAPNRSYGIKASGDNNSINWQIGYFQDDNTEKSNGITAKMTWAPWLENKNVLHVGASFSERRMHGEVFRINQNMEVHTTDSLIEGAEINADGTSSTGIELLWQHSGFVNIAEWQQSTVKAESGSEYDYDGGYYQLSYLFSGKNRKYKNGKLSSLKTQNDWEVSLRYSQLNLRAENSEADVLSLGLNYYFNKDLKLMSNFIRAKYIEEGINLGSGNAISIRTQYQF